ncbi:hypothetical protein BDY17DRAFT_92087 [Neohortaea acidophila]|uniref:Uncharacterized protein n=1 Tax=Neohortaea acidophila TaxID=245834 RepID=A0A6A6PXU8_9PEZI|nr:uncharacterized protein BDY17DRAFT_92087 [Neohortaea acidophila]KAF2484835.1 hypothetical protein BDY17DRAFT_92087 [Neohortaea acidophila]
MRRPLHSLHPSFLPSLTSISCSNHRHLTLIAFNTNHIDIIHIRHQHANQSSSSDHHRGSGRLHHRLAHHRPGPSASRPENLVKQHQHHHNRQLGPPQGQAQSRLGPIHLRRKQHVQRRVRHLLQRPRPAHRRNPRLLGRDGRHRRLLQRRAHRLLRFPILLLHRGRRLRRAQGRRGAKAGDDDSRPGVRELRAHWDCGAGESQSY